MRTSHDAYPSMLLTRLLASVAAWNVAMRRMPSGLATNGSAQDTNSTCVYIPNKHRTTVHHWTCRFTRFKGLRADQWLPYHVVRT